MSQESALNAILSLIAEHIPEEMLIETLQSALDEYKETILLHKPENEKKESLGRLSTVCVLVLQKATGTTAEESIKSFDQFQRVMELVKNQPQ